jgi:hypothetical protein
MGIASTLRLGSGSGIGTVLTTKRYNEGGNAGGSERNYLFNLDIDANFAGNGTATEPAVKLDVVRPIVEMLSVKNGVLNLFTKMSRNISPGTEKLEDGIFTKLGLKDPQTYNLDSEGPHDSLFDIVNARSNVEGFPNIRMRGSAPVLRRAHPYGNAQYALDLEAGDVYDSTFEGGRLGQVLIGNSGRRLWGCWLFAGGGADGKIGYVFGANEAAGCFDVHIFNTQIDNCTNGALKFNTSTTARLLVTGYVTGSEGNVITGPKEPNTGSDFRQLYVSGGQVDNSKLMSAAAVENMPAPCRPFLELTGAGTLKNLQFGEKPGQELTLVFKETATVVVTGNIRLTGSVSFVGTPNDTLTLKLLPNGNWTEVSRAVI